MFCTESHDYKNRISYNSYNYCQPFTNIYLKYKIYSNNIGRYPLNKTQLELITECYLLFIKLDISVTAYPIRSTSLLIYLLVL